jgi:zinc transport system permease protein
MARTSNTTITESTMLELLGYGFMQHALIGGIAIAIITGLIGPFLVLRRLSLLGDGLAHLAFGGVALGFLLNYNPFIVALVVVVCGSLAVQRLMRRNIYGDAAIALILSFGVGLGVIITGVVHGFTVDLFTFLIGSILTLSQADLILIFAVLLVVVGFVSFYYRKMLYMTFNEELARLGRRDYTVVNLIFTLLVALAVAVSIRAVGILLVSALLVLPTLVALQLSKSFRSTMVIATIASLAAMTAGIFASFTLDMPPSGMIVTILFVLFFAVSVKPVAHLIKQIF